MGQDQTMEKRLQFLLDREEIRQEIYRYARGVDRREPALVRAAYHDDAWDEHGSFRGDGDAVVAAVMKAKPNAIVTSSMHHIGNILIELDGDFANVETYFVAYQRRLENDKAFIRARAGRYLDRFERRGGRWCVLRRTVADDWSRVDEIVATAAEVGPDNTIGTRDRSDISYSLSSFAGWGTHEPQNHGS